MGLFDRLLKVFNIEPASAKTPVHVPQEPPAFVPFPDAGPTATKVLAMPLAEQEGPNPTRALMTSSPNAIAWVPPGTSVWVPDATLPGGMLYYGRLPQGKPQGNRDGEVIDPALPIDWDVPDYGGRDVPAQPAYHSLTPQARAAYVLWLESGRRATTAHIGYVFLYFYGLERRALVDAARDPVAKADLPRVLVEVTRLIEVYGHHAGFRAQAEAFQQVLRVLGGGDVFAPPDPAVLSAEEVAHDLAVGIGGFVADERPVPADWAWAWATSHPAVSLKSAATRYPELFRALFHARYRAQHGAGMVVRPLKRRVKLSYDPANPAIKSAALSADLPDVISAAAPTKVLTALVDSCTEDLGPYSRLLARNPAAEGTLTALLLLPAELFDHPSPVLANPSPELEELLDLIDEALPGRTWQCGVDVSDLVALWPARATGKFTKADAVGMAELLGRLGVGIEPDARLGGPVQSEGPAVLFRVTAEQPKELTPAYASATALLHLAAVVSTADDEVSDAEWGHLVAYLQSRLDLTPGERMRLTAHLDWLLVSPLKLTGLAKRISVLGEEQRAQIAEVASAIAAADGEISDSEVAVLRKIYKLLGQDPDSVRTGIVAFREAQTKPVTMLQGGSDSGGGGGEVAAMLTFEEEQENS
ncbi:MULTISPECIES: TerB N-terminal domain-containing protein [Actinosynnema]|uniref:tellurite resistance TerB family protein n=1 Tax=Actinosynnema TaxID=40566 RepID=UPI0020A34CC9|nr:TerB N-terminal domain-containing protein [Actinosynnema pretiosum]MCP2095025.1 putative conserved protein, tellurite resistance protein B (TerB) family [Actinosynnema pretiosum]